ncbi:hypothetical protein BDK51DRAFT_26070 [Blyttiomyces helicus]|uniref:Uncharacterized protein n=1 Tax=Blyttiomyces helicus TaxID=388810 RepID=A0A4P9WJP1_9FUNG|nr:hypothetical protein BDK51DRAFT_26070 [Blyttiomyces helicus]|eukprot:RKO91748.1 hypothetical protein BDK51DRAFT_26070 [Blyttiomyces helicus]
MIVSDHPMRTISTRIEVRTAPCSCGRTTFLVATQKSGTVKSHGNFGTWNGLHMESLVGRDYKAFVQVEVSTGHRIMGGLPTAKWAAVQDALGQLAAFDYARQIKEGDKYVSKLKNSIRSLHFAVTSASIILLGGEKFHFLVHLLVDVHRFGSPTLFATKRHSPQAATIVCPPLHSLRSTDGSSLAHWSKLRGEDQTMIVTVQEYAVVYQGQDHAGNRVDIHYNTSQGLPWGMGCPAQTSTQRLVSVLIPHVLGVLNTQLDCQYRRCGMVSNWRVWKERQVTEVWYLRVEHSHPYQYKSNMICRPATQTVYQKLPWARDRVIIQEKATDQARSQVTQDLNKAKHETASAASSQVLSTFVHIQTPGEMAPMAADIYLIGMVGSW